MFHTVREYKYYTPLKRCAILTLQNFAAEKLIFVVRKLTKTFASIFHTMKIDFFLQRKTFANIVFTRNEANVLQFFAE